MTMIDWYRLMKAKEDDLLVDLSNWIKIKSIHDEKTVSNEKPFGNGISQAFEYIINLAQEDGFITKDDNGYACHIDYGNKDKTVGILGHLDVVDVGDNWSIEPFSGTILDEYIYGRGIQDNKGPMMAAYYGMKLVKELKLPLKNKIRMIIGGNEELEWKCIEHYFNNYPKPDFGFTPDGDFPIIYAEKEIINYTYTGEYIDDEIVSISAGTTITSVCDKATAKVTNKTLKNKFINYVTENNLEYNITENKNNLEITIYGKSAHAASPHRGINAASHLLVFLADCTDNKMVKHFSKMFIDTYGKGLNIEYSDKKMGSLTSSLGIVRYQNNQYEFIIDIRYPLDIDKKIMKKQLLKNGIKVEWEKAYANKTAFRNGMFLDLESNLIQTLHNVYSQQTNDYISKPLCKGGDTYARACENIVCFGILFPDAKDTMHHSDECIKVDDLIRGAAIYAQAIYELGNL